MANEESPYEKLDLSYFEMPVPNTEEVTAVRFLSKQGLADLWSKISEKFIRPVSGGTEGQVLTYKGTGLYDWDDVATELPDVIPVEKGGTGCTTIDGIRTMLFNFPTSEELFSDLGLK